MAIDMETFTNAFGEVLPRGQITLDSAFGRELTRQAVRAETIVEVGTWFGLGSTACLAAGLIRPSQRLWTIEVNAERHAQAKLKYNDARIEFLWGCALDLGDKLPIRIDLLLLDGDDLSSDAEFDLYQGRSRVIALDDTNERKNRRQFAMLQAQEWRVIAADHRERHGWAIFERPEPAS